MKNKKIILLIVITSCLFVVTGCGKETITPSEPTKTDIVLSNHEVANLVKYEKELPKFEIQIGGIVNAALSEYDLKYNEIYPYEFDASVETPWGYQTNKYVGYSVKEILSVLKRTDYKSVSAISSFGTEVTYPLSVVNGGKLYLVFYKDGQKISNGKMAVISVDENEKYFVSNVVKLTANNVEAK